MHVAWLKDAQPQANLHQGPSKDPTGNFPSRPQPPTQGHPDHPGPRPGAARVHIHITGPGPGVRARQLEGGRAGPLPVPRWAGVRVQPAAGPVRLGVHVLSGY